MSQRFFIDKPLDSKRVLLTGDQAHHASNVMRVQVGSQITLFDGKGSEFCCRVVRVLRKEVDLEVIQTIQIDRELETQLTFAIAVPKSERQKFLIEKLVELGVTRLIPWTANRSVAVPNVKSLVRMRKQVIEASKQCERNRLMQIEDPMNLDRVIEQAANNNSDCRIFGDPDAETPIASVKSDSKSVLIVIGPEGGIDRQESELLVKTRFQAIRFGKSILRVETAAIAAAAILGAGRSC
ncbi:MAG: RsmE family RNA methyltransferase [Planctomycetota bacterium]